jgi:heparosan-N-sulfate-glucuronate 5-epimerase
MERYSAIKSSMIAISLMFLLLASSESLHVFLKQIDAYPYMRYKKKESTFIVEDSKGIPYVNYGHFDKTDVGFQRSPVTIAQKAISNFYELKRTGEEKYKDLLINNANWIIDNAIYNPAGNFSILEYKFPWPVYNLTAPWHSAMAQAQAIEALMYAYDITHDKKYTDTAKLLLNSFFVEVKEGGVTYKNLSLPFVERNDYSKFKNSSMKENATNREGGLGWWYELFAGNNNDAVISKVLNGHMFTLLSIYKYYDYTHDEDAKHIFNQGIVALKDNLPRYDNESFSHYDILKTNPTFRYHYYHIKVLKQLYDITHEQIFWDYSKTWSDYFKSKSLFYEEIYNRIIRRYRL